jgi:hypothetical protein
MVLVRAVPLVLMGCLVACGGARAKARVSTESSAEAEVDFDKEGALGDSAGDSDGAIQTTSANSNPLNKNAKFGPPALLGARHDVRLEEPSKKLACQCLAAVFGSSGMTGLTWSDLPPSLDESSQTLVVIESDGVPCEDAQAPGASYMGYHKEGEDVVIDVEAAHPGRPVTRGAVVPLPAGGGRVMISAPSSLPYGKKLSGDGRCAL